MDENDPVDDSEFVYRRIHAQFYDPTLPISVQREAFRPNQNDTTGISVLRGRYSLELGLMSGKLAKSDTGTFRDQAECGKVVS